MPPKEEQSKEAIEDMYVEALNARKQEEESLENKTLDELDELEDELEDDRIIMEYRYVTKGRGGGELSNVFSKDVNVC